MTESKVIENCVEYTVKIENGTKTWYLNEKRHRENGPAVERVDGTKEWYQFGLLHREDGPAIEWNNGYKEWYINGKFHNEYQFNKRTN